MKSILRWSDGLSGSWWLMVDGVFQIPRPSDVSGLDYTYITKNIWVILQALCGPMLIDGCLHCPFWHMVTPMCQLCIIGIQPARAAWLNVRPHSYTIYFDTLSLLPLRPLLVWGSLLDVCQWRSGSIWVRDNTCGLWPLEAISSASLSREIRWQWVRDYCLNGSHYSKPNLVKTCFLVARGRAIQKQAHVWIGRGNLPQVQSGGANFCYSSEPIMLFVPISFCGKHCSMGWHRVMYSKQRGDWFLNYL